MKTASSYILGAAATILIGYLAVSFVLARTDWLANLWEWDWPQRFFLLLSIAWLCGVGVLATYSRNLRD